MTVCAGHEAGGSRLPPQPRARCDEGRARRHSLRQARGLRVLGFRVWCLELVESTLTFAQARAPKIESENGAECDLMIGVETRRFPAP